MEITDFLTTDFLASFTGTLIAVELIVFITKDFPLIKKIPTKIYTLILAIAHLSIERVATPHPLQIPSSPAMIGTFFGSQILLTSSVLLATVLSVGT